MLYASMIPEKNSSNWKGLVSNPTTLVRLMIVQYGEIYFWAPQETNGHQRSPATFSKFFSFNGQELEALGFA